VNKTDLIEMIAKKADLSKASAGRALEATLESIVETVAHGDSVTLIGFGTFESRKRAARAGINPMTMAAIKIAAATVPAFKAGKGFKETVNKSKGSKKK